MEEAEELSDRVGIIDHGKLIALGTQKELTKLVGQQESLRLHLGEGITGESVQELFANVDGVLQSNALDGEVIPKRDGSGDGAAWCCHGGQCE